MWAPRLDNTEALQTEALHFIDCITNKKQPLTDGNAGLRMVQMIEAAELSLQDRGRLWSLSCEADQFPDLNVRYALACSEIELKTPGGFWRESRQAKAYRTIEIWKMISSNAF
jgi:hypothetical protein